MGMLMQLVNTSVDISKVLSKSHILTIASSRLMHIIAISCCIYARELDSSIIQRVVDSLYEQLVDILENKPTDVLLYMNQNSLNRLKSNYDKNLGNFLVFLRTLASSSTVQKILASKKWVDVLLIIITDK